MSGYKVSGRTLLYRKKCPAGPFFTEKSARPDPSLQKKVPGRTLLYRKKCPGLTKTLTMTKSPKWAVERFFSKTQMFQEFRAEFDEGMHSKMTDVEIRAKSPAFFDVAGIPNQSKYSKLIQAMAQGKVKDETEINPLLEAKPEDMGNRREKVLKH